MSWRWVVVASRVQLALNVSDVEEAVGFYRKLFGVEPAKRRPGYANFAVDVPPLKLVLIENPSARGAGVSGALNHLGVEVDSSDEVTEAAARLAGQAAVGAYVGAAYWFTSSTSFANPAITVGRMLSDTFAGIAPASVPPFVAAQCGGAVLAVGLVRLLYPTVTPTPSAERSPTTPEHEHLRVLP